MRPAYEARMAQPALLEVLAFVQDRVGGRDVLWAEAQRMGVDWSKHNHLQILCTPFHRHYRIVKHSCTNAKNRQEVIRVTA